MFARVFSTFLLVTMFLTVSPAAFGQNCGQGQSKKVYVYVALGMDEAQGGSQVEGNLVLVHRTSTIYEDNGLYRGEARVINGYDFQYKESNLSDQRCGFTFTFGGKPGINRFMIKNESGIFYDVFRADSFARNEQIGPWGRLTNTLMLAPGASGLETGWAEIGQDGTYERITSVGTIRLYQNGQVVSQFSMRPVEAKLTNFVPVFNAPRDNQRTGFAVGNPYFEEVRVTIQLLDRNGDQMGQPVEKTLGVYGNFATFVNELFPIPPYFEGLLKITSTREVPVTAIDGRVSQDRFLMSLVGAN